MEAFQKHMDEMVQKSVNIVHENSGATRSFNTFLNNVERDIAQFKKTGVINFAFDDSPRNHNDNDKETEETDPERIFRKSKQVKLERVSVGSSDDNSEMPPPPLPLKRGKKAVASAIKIEPMRTTRSKTSKKNIVNEDTARSMASMSSQKSKKNDRDSDVILENGHMSILSLSDTDDDYTNQNKATLIKQEKLSVGSAKNKSSEFEDDARKPRTKRTKKSKKPKAAENKKSSIYEDCLSNAEQDHQVAIQNNATFVLQQNEPNKTEATTQKDKIADATVVLNRPAMNETVVLDKQALTLTDQNVVPSTTEKLNVEDLMTDDDSIHEDVPKYTIKPKITKAQKAIFSPFESSPVKKRVEAFEKLKADAASNESGLSSGTKTRNKLRQAKENEDQKNETSKVPIRDKSKLTPLMSSRFFPSCSSSANKIMNNTETSKVPTKYHSALKASQQEFRERELLRKERETEAMCKKEALLLTQMEEKKRKREEKQFKAQQAREAYEKTKQKMHEQQKLKDEKYKQAVAEKQAKHQKIREEAEKRRVLATKRAMEEKNKEEERKRAHEELTAKLEKDKKIANEKDLPIYMTMKAPLLPTEECYDSDDSEGANVKVNCPSWMRSNVLRQKLMVMHCLGEKAKNTFFVCESQTPDLREIFKNIDPRKLKRTSSAIWHKPPRFTLLPLMSNSINESDEEEMED